MVNFRPTPIGFKPKMKPMNGITFFDRSVIRTNWSRINKTPIRRSGLLVRKIARNSIKRRKPGGKPGPVGQPPRSRQPGSNPPMKMIFSVPNNKHTKAYVGMVGFNRSSRAPALHEHGGRAYRNVPKGPKQFRNINGRNQFIGRKTKRMQVRYPKRPFMKPALMKAKPKIAEFWKNAMSRARR